MKHKQRWAGAICCFVLFIGVVCLFLATHMKGAFRAAGHPEIGLLFFILPGAVASFFSQRREVLETSIWRNAGGTCPMLIMRLFFSPTRSFWQELAWLLSAVFCVRWGHCVSYLSVACLNHSTEKISKALNARACQTIRRPDSLSPMQQNRYSRRYVADRQKSAARFLRVYLPFVVDLL